MFAETTMIDLSQEAHELVNNLRIGDPYASNNLARLIEADTKGVFVPFAEALAARLSDHLERWAEMGETDPSITLEDEVYQLLKAASSDWDGLPNGDPSVGE